MTSRKRFSTVNKILLVQVLMAMVIASGFFVLGGWGKALSPLLGGLIALLPNVYFAYRLHLSRNWDAKKMLRSFYASESKKIFLTVGLFAIVFQLPNINLITLLTGYIAVLSVFWFALILWRDY